MKINLINPDFTHDYVRQLLEYRGVEDVDAFFKPTSVELQPPTNLKNIRIAAALYTRVVTDPKARILLVIDCDCDGYTSAAIIYQYTKLLNPNCQIDYWLHEGKQHGLQDHIDKLMAEDVHFDLIILPDSSSNDRNYHDMLDEINTPCLVLDHHLTDTSLSNNAIIVNNQLSPNYTNKELTGAGVVYQFCRYIDEITGNNWANEFIDLAALGVVGDMGSMLEMENRYIVTTGFSHITNSMFKRLLTERGYSITGKTGFSWEDIVEKTNPTSVAFYVVPLINAMIRVGTMEAKERLFLAFVDGGRQVPSGKRGAKGTMERVDVESTRECINAKNRQDKLKESAVSLLEAKIFKHDLLENKVLFVRLEDDDDFPSELTGLIAMQLSVKFKRPTIVARLNDEGFNRGSARGLNQSELKDFKQFLTDSGLFEYAQGHANAFGCSIPDSKLRTFHEYANQKLGEIDFGENVYDVSFVRDGRASDLTALITEIGKAFAIWGQNNPQPLIAVNTIKVCPDNVRVMGANKDTLRIDFNGIPYVRFHAKELISELAVLGNKATLNLVGKPNLNEWMGRTSPQMFIEAYQILDNNF